MPQLRVVRLPHEEAMTDRRMVVDECICQNPECWGFTCPVHRMVCRATVPLRDENADANREMGLPEDGDWGDK